jgi:hypothetical protein
MITGRRAMDAFLFGSIHIIKEEGEEGEEEEEGETEEDEEEDDPIADEGNQQLLTFSSYVHQEVTYQGWVGRCRLNS